MSGVKGRSGRRTNHRDLLHYEILKKSERVIGEYLDDPDVDRSEKIKVATLLYAKSIPNDINLDNKLKSHVRAIVSFKEVVKKDQIEDAEVVGD